jgi:UDP-N-acetylmuramate: L-alanyl-gamma-D-glutamyl-meso-diaminopimelate ligase
MNPKHVHFVAIAGTGMGSLAGLLRSRGIRVTGSDENVYPPMSTMLERWGIPVFQGYAAEHVLAERPDLVVIGNAVRPTNAEARAAIDGGLRYLSFSDALYQLAIAGKHSVVIAGTHGKTTTTSLVATVLLAAGRDPSLLVGGVAENFGGSFREGAGPHFVVEGDEYDTAFFDKTPKFLHYGAQTAVITSVEFDHADIYRDLDHVKDSFRQLVQRMPEDGTLVAALDHAGVRDVVDKAPCRVVEYGVDEVRDDVGGPGARRDLRPGWRARDLTSLPEGTRFTALRDGREVARPLVPMHGRHNVENAVAALAVADVLGVPVADAVAGLATFRGVKRRQETRGEAHGVLVIDDFAHHPTAVRETIAAVRAQHPTRRLVAVFEPRTNTSRRKVFQREYARAFDGAARVVVVAVPDAPIYSATGEVTERFSAAELAADLRARGVEAVAIDGVDAIVDELAGTLVPGDVVLGMSNGGFGGFYDKLLAKLRA